MGLSLESPISWDGSTAYDKATRRDSPHASSFSPFYAIKALRLSRRLSQKHSATTPELSSAQYKPTRQLPEASGSTQNSMLFTLPHHLREHLYSLLINETGSRVLHIMRKFDYQPKARRLRFRPCRATGDLPCATVCCRPYLDMTTRTYRGSFSSIVNLLLISKDIRDELLTFLYTHYEFNFDHPTVILDFCKSISLQASVSLRFVSFEPQCWFFTHTDNNMMVPRDIWELTWRTLGQSQNLQQLAVRYPPPWRKLPCTLEFLDPRQYIKLRPTLRIEVRAPWIQSKQFDHFIPSSPLLRIPRDLREQIYEYVFDPTETRTIAIDSKRVFHNHNVCTALGFIGSGYYCCPESASFQSPGYKSSIAAKQFIYPITRKRLGFNGLLRVSRDVSHEASELLWSRYEFLFDHPLSLIGFMNKLPVLSRGMIRKIGLNFGEELFRGQNLNPSLTFGIEFDMWGECWRIVNHIEKLKELRVRFKTRGIAPAEGSKLDPRTCLERTERLSVFQLKAPWIERSKDGKLDEG